MIAAACTLDRERETTGDEESVSGGRASMAKVRTRGQACEDVRVRRVRACGSGAWGRAGLACEEKEVRRVVCREAAKQRPGR